MGSNVSTKVDNQPIVPPTQSACPVTSKSSSLPSQNAVRCPIDHKSSKYKNSSQFNVYGQKIEPTNQMPSIPAQEIAPGQKVPLSTEREQSNIPKAGTDSSTWVYPSAQMFWNALSRKKKLEGVTEQDVDTVVAIHNNMNELTWNQVLEWEKLHPVTGPGREPKLLRFMGRPDEYSPKARMKMMFGHPAPFDRHDWIVDRGGQEVRYIIDYYHDESVIGLDSTPKHLKDMHSMKSIQVDVRPALDSFTSIQDRIIGMPWRYYLGTTNYHPPAFFPPTGMITAEQLKIKKLLRQWDEIQTNCYDLKEKLKICSSEEECGAASIALQRCTAKIACEDIVHQFDKCVEEKPPNIDKISNHHDNMTKCLDLFQIDVAKAIEKVKK